MCLVTKAQDFACPFHPHAFSSEPDIPDSITHVVGIKARGVLPKLTRAEYTKRCHPVPSHLLEPETEQAILALPERVDNYRGSVVAKLNKVSIR